eukprot:COSAG06_NODE_17644_length_928_cov_1.646562_2_plen_62_part_01
MQLLQPCRRRELTCAVCRQTNEADDIVCDTCLTPRPGLSGAGGAGGAAGGGGGSQGQLVAGV